MFSILLMQGCRVWMHSFTSPSVREWKLCRPALLVALQGSAVAPDGVLISQEGGRVLKVDINNQAAVPLLSHSTEIRCAAAPRVSCVTIRLFHHMVE